MTSYQYVPLLGAIFNLVLSAFVLGSDRRSRLNQIFFAWGLCIVTWNLGTFALFRTTSHAEAYQWAKAMQFGVIFIPITMLHLCLLLTGIKPGWWLRALYFFHLALAVMNVFDVFISDVRNVGYAYYSVAGPGFWIYTLAFSQSFVALTILWRKRQSLPPRHRRRFDGILMAQSLLVTLGTNDILPILGIDNYPIINSPIIPYGSLAAVAYGVMVAYSVLQHQLLDVHLALGRSAAYIVRFLFLMLIAVVLELCVATVAPPGTMTTFAFTSSLLVIFVASLLASFLFPKLLGGAAEELERRLLGDHFEYEDKVRAFTEASRWHVELPALLTELHQLFEHTIRVRSYAIILFDETRRTFSVARSHPQSPSPIELRVDSPVFRHFLRRNSGYLSLNAVYEPDDELERSACEQLRAFSGDIAFPLIAEDQPVGVLILGQKVNGDPFTRTDTQLLTSLTENLALVIHQISLKNQLLLNQELDLLGRMSRGMAHDLNNLTTPLWTMLQLIGEGLPTDVLRQELVPVAIRNIQTMRAYIKEALFFSENLRPDIQLGRLDVLLESVVLLARENPRKGKSVQFTLATGGETLVEMDAVLMQRLFMNLIANAVDASPEHSEIRIHLTRLARVEPHRDWYRVSVTDSGSGIAPEDLNRIFQPYFTTKKTGDENRGFGLGLAICRKIASLHGASLSVQSELGRGTTVNLDLPNRQKAAISPALTQPLVTAPPQPTST